MSVCIIYMQKDLHITEFHSWEAYQGGEHLMQLAGNGQWAWVQFLSR
jgi:Cu2+-containing amine oxidase